VLAIHLALYATVLSKVGQWPLVNFGVIDLLELAALAALFKQIGRTRQDSLND
jgi:hypothetical protein